MRTSALVATAALTALAGCGASNLNPLNWFGGRDAAPAVATTTGDAAPAEPVRPAVAQVTSLRVEDTPGGVLVTAIGLPPTQGWFAAELVPEATDVADRPVPVDGTITFRFAAVPPEQPHPQGTPRSREISAGVFLGDASLRNARRIVVEGESNARSARP